MREAEERGGGGLEGKNVVKKRFCYLSNYGDLFFLFLFLISIINCFY